MSPYIMKNVSIDNNMLKINIDFKIDEIDKHILIELFCIINAFKTLEKKNGNEYDKAFIKLEYEENMIIEEYINIFNLIRSPNFYEFMKYFLTIRNRTQSQNVETKLNIDDYLNRNENISQKIIIIMVFKIESNIDELSSKVEKLISIIKMTDIDDFINDILKEF